MKQPKFKWSYFVDSDNNEQFIVSCNDPKEFQEAITFAQGLLQNQKFGQIKESEQEPEIPPNQCQLHNRPMKRRKTKANLYYHRWQGEDGIWYTCDGKTILGT